MTNTNFENKQYCLMRNSWIEEQMLNESLAIEEENSNSSIKQIAVLLNTDFRGSKINPVNQFKKLIEINKGFSVQFLLRLYKKKSTLQLRNMNRVKLMRLIDKAGYGLVVRNQYYDKVRYKTRIAKILNPSNLTTRKQQIGEIVKENGFIKSFEFLVLKSVLEREREQRQKNAVEVWDKYPSKKEQ